MPSSATNALAVLACSGASCAALAVFGEDSVAETACR
jgi:hypothetical protein